MKNIINRLKKGFGLQEAAAIDSFNTHAQTQRVSLIPSTQALREAIISFIIQSLQPYVDEKSLSVSGLHFYIVCGDQQQEEAAVFRQARHVQS
jgi:DNA gyrase/topoisomerase IV subunit B